MNTTHVLCNFCEICLLKAVANTTTGAKYRIFSILMEVAPAVVPTGAPPPAPSVAKSDIKLEH